MVGQLPLQDLKVLEFAGLAPGPFAGMLLADAGASVLRIDRAIPGQTHQTHPKDSSTSNPNPHSPSSPPPPPPPTPDMLARHKSSIAVDLKSPRGTSLIRTLAREADVLIDPFRPGVLEKLGLGPSVLCAENANPRLIYARMTGFRRDGRYAAMAGHDINYLAVSGVLSLLGTADPSEPPRPPWNILADFAGGGAVLVQGIMMALLARDRPGGNGGRGQVVEANMVDGSSYLATFPRMALKTPLGAGPRGTNLLDGGAPFYSAYTTRDNKYVAVGALEPQFFALLIKGLGLEGHGWEAKQNDRACWAEMRRVFAAGFAGRTRGEWEGVFDGTDACVTPVLGYGELEKGQRLGEGREGRREGDQRPIVGLRDTPCLAVDERVSDPSMQGRGAGVPGGGYVPSPLAPGEGGEEVLRRWVGWNRGTEFDVEGGGLVLKEKEKEKSKL
ncbi:Uu.00g093860.m01.CDS01 [Anthostomella pinea]|uniref:Uu.00g093860.m01.CDS01 n=1 Tax=Anthostomella pinea TaxID=933095 RepID=A0AAI8VPQ6_9PEZI|nr:Uu.00g093860.m01.CDS01 [Anthostomella pinea]